MNKKIDDKVNKILDASYELCENKDEKVAYQANVINNGTYELQKDMVDLRRSIYTILHKASESKGISMAYFSKIFKNHGINLKE